MKTRCTVAVSAGRSSVALLVCLAACSAQPQPPSVPQTPYAAAFATPDTDKNVADPNAAAENKVPASASEPTTGPVFSNANLKGRYRLLYRSPATQPEGNTGTGNVEFDGVSRMWGADSFGARFEGTYHVNPDGSGTVSGIAQNPTVSLDAPPRDQLPYASRKFHSDLIVHPSGGVEFISTGPEPRYPPMGILRKVGD